MCEDDTRKIHMGMICSKCRWWDSENEVCCNADSDMCADFTCWYEWCNQWEEKP